MLDLIYGKKSLVVITSKASKGILCKKQVLVRRTMRPGRRLLVGEKEEEEEEVVVCCGGGQY